MPEPTDAHAGADPPSLGPRGLLDHHRRLLEVASGISPDVVAERGYWSATEASELAALGFSPGQRLVPALVIPIWTVNGVVGLHQIRPDNPRIVGDKIRKYEIPARSKLVLDIPPRVRPVLDDPSVRLHITEGSRKTDSAVSQGLFCIGLLGVWGWRGTNEYGGKTALPDWDKIALNGRELPVYFDSDVMRNPKVFAALSRLGTLLSSRDGLPRYGYFPEGENGAKTGFDDFFVSGASVADLEALIEERLRKPGPRLHVVGAVNGHRAGPLPSSGGSRQINVGNENPPRWRPRRGMRWWPPTIRHACSAPVKDRCG